MNLMTSPVPLEDHQWDLTPYVNDWLIVDEPETDAERYARQMEAVNADKAWERKYPGGMFLAAVALAVCAVVLGVAWRML